MFCVRRGARYSESILGLDRIDFLISFHIDLLWEHCQIHSTNAARPALCLNLKSELEHPTSCTAARRAREGARTKVGMQGFPTLAQKICPPPPIPFPGPRFNRRLDDPLNNPMNHPSNHPTKGLFSTGGKSPFYF